MLEPASADAEIESPARENINGASHLREQRGIAIAIARDQLADADTFGIACNSGGGGPALKRYFLRWARDGVKVVDKPGGLKTYLVGGLSNARHRLIGFDRVFNACQVHCPTLWQGYTKFQRHNKYLFP